MTEQQIKDFVARWYVVLDQHAPIDQAYALLNDRVRMKFPDGDIHNLDGFKTWYERVTNLFFDENHTVQTVESTIQGDEAKLRVVVGWQASWFEPPAPKSKRVSMDATQDWTVRTSSKNPWGLEIVYYDAQAEPFSYAPGFARL